MTKRDLLLLCLIGLLAFGGYKWFERDQSSRRQRAAVQASEAVQEALERQVSLDILGPKRKLGDVLKLLEDRSEVRFYHDVAEWKNAGIDTDTLIHVPAATVSLRSALQLLLEDIELVATPRDGSLLITTVEVAESTLTAQLYRLPQSSEGGDVDATGNQWRELISSTMFPQSWDDVGGPSHIEAIPGALMIVTTDHAHHEIRGFLAQFAAPPPAPSGPGAFLHFASAEERRIYAALAEKDSVFFVETPLSDVVKYFSQQHGIPIELANKKLQDAAVSVDTPITRTLRGISLRSILKVILDDLDLAYVIRDNVLLITTPEGAESYFLRPVAYDVRDLVETRSGQADFDSLIDLITSTVSAQSWDDVGGPGSLYAIGNNWIVFSQTDEVHQEAAALLAALRESLSRPPDDSGVAATTVFPVGDSLEDVKVRQALEQPVELEFVETPIKDVSAYLEDVCQINVVLDAKRMEEAAVSVDTPVDCKLLKLPLRTALELLLAPLELVAIPSNEMLLINTAEGAEGRYDQTRIYDVRGLSSGESGDRFVELCTSVIHRESWDELGGPGSIDVYRGLLVVRHREAIHRDLEALFRALHEQLGVK